MAGSIADVQVVHNGSHVLVLTSPCQFCGNQSQFTLNREAYEAWQRGAHIQDVFPELSADDRETLISGSCGPCFDKAFGGM